MYTLTVGLEIHAELKTATKMFCACRNEPDAAPNSNVCPVCLAHPGSLPAINKEAVRKVLLVGKAVGGELADYTEFDRKNYFYPDIPKGYQLSQYAHPLVRGGALGGVRLTRIHLEEDTGRSEHKGETSLVDYNRAGVPLMELVTEPVIRSAEEAGAFARELQLLLRTLGAGEANMEKGEMRVEANISISKDETLGTKVEVKNLNSFRSVERAVRYEVARQTKLLETGAAVEQETRGWDEAKQETFSQRKKEGSADYRYFPDPDLPSLRVSEIPALQELGLPELPAARRARYAALGFLQPQDIEQLTADFELARFFDEAAAALAGAEERKAAANFILNDIAGRRKTEPGWLPAPALFVEVVRKYAAGELPSPQAKQSLQSGAVAAVASGAELEAVAAQVVAAHPGPAGEYKAGKAASLQFLIGQGMKLSKGSASPQSLKEALLKILG